MIRIVTKTVLSNDCLQQNIVLPKVRLTSYKIMIKIVTKTVLSNDTAQQNIVLPKGSMFKKFDVKCVTFKGPFGSINLGIERMFKSRNVPNRG